MASWRRSAPSGDRGFSLIEVVAAVGFLSISFLGLTSLTLMTIKATSHTRNVSAATNLARSKIEELRRVGYAGVSGGSDPMQVSESGATGVAKAIYTRSWSVTTGPTATTKAVSVTVAWADAGGKEVTLETLVGR